MELADYLDNMSLHKNKNWFQVEGGFMKKKKIAAIPTFNDDFEKRGEQQDIEFGKKARGGQYFKRYPASELIKPENKRHRRRLRKQEKLFGITTLT